MTTITAFYFVSLICLSSSFYLSTTVQSFSIQTCIITNKRRASVTSSLLLLAAETSNNNGNPTKKQNEAHDNICWHPCSIQVSNVSHQYPDTLWRKLTSSEPRRQFAVEDLSLSLDEPEFVLLLGDSSSGKSTLLRLILGLETPISGTIEIISNNDDKTIQPAVPVLLDQRPVYSNRPQTVQVLLQERLTQMKKQPPQLQENKALVQKILESLCDTMDLPLDKKGSDLSPSEAYRCTLAEASLESMLTGQCQKDQIGDGTITDNSPKSSSSFPAPILFLDEWMDKETSTVVQNVQASIMKLVKRGAIVVSITHKPNLYKRHSTLEEEEEGSSSVRSITLRRGKIVA
mmetsp:Transcript_44343/g.106817  ORF Transcript_44343/g.106817 Transcript_44343/m.106817 type:complete len:346 (+) Transcript_44343:26-1063(+)